MTKSCHQRKRHGFCRKCRADVRRGKSLTVVRGKPYCETCAATLRARINDVGVTR